MTHDNHFQDSARNTTYGQKLPQSFSRIIPSSSTLRFIIGASIFAIILFFVLFESNVGPNTTYGGLWDIGYAAEAIAPVYVIYRLFRWLVGIDSSTAWFAGIGLVVVLLVDVYYVVGIFTAPSFLPLWEVSSYSCSNNFVTAAYCNEAPALLMLQSAFLIPAMIIGVGVFFALDYIGYRFFRKRSEVDIHIHATSWG